MMATWADDEDIVCVHPGGARLVGYDAVRASWEQIFAGDGKLAFRLEQVVDDGNGRARDAKRRSSTSMLADGNRARRRDRHQHLHAHAVGMADGVHHASPSPTVAQTQQSGPLH